MSNSGNRPRDRLRDNINDVLSHADVHPTRTTTHCNRAAERIIRQQGVDTSELLNSHPRTGRPDADWTSANDMARNAARAAGDPTSRVTEVSPDDAQRLANEGHVVLAAQERRSRRPGRTAHGHVGVVAPADSQDVARDGPLIGQAGQDVDVIDAKRAFRGSRSKVRYYAVDPPP